MSGTLHGMPLRLAVHAKSSLKLMNLQERWEASNARKASQSTSASVDVAVTTTEAASATHEATAKGVAKALGCMK